MGMFDRVHYQAHWWQTKDLTNTLTDYRVGTDQMLYKATQVRKLRMWLRDYFTGSMLLLCEECPGIVEVRLTFEAGKLLGEGPVTDPLAEAPTTDNKLTTGEPLGGVSKEPQGVPAEVMGWPLSRNQTIALFMAHAVICHDGVDLKEFPTMDTLVNSAVAEG